MYLIGMVERSHIVEKELSDICSTLVGIPLGLIAGACEGIYFPTHIRDRNQKTLDHENLEQIGVSYHGARFIGRFFVDTYKSFSRAKPLGRYATLAFMAADVADGDVSFTGGLVLTGICLSGVYEGVRGLVKYRNRHKSINSL